MDEQDGKLHLPSNDPKLVYNLKKQIAPQTTAICMGTTKLYKLVLVERLPLATRGLTHFPELFQNAEIPSDLRVGEGGQFCSTAVSAPSVGASVTGSVISPPDSLSQGEISYSLSQLFEKKKEKKSEIEEKKKKGTSRRICRDLAVKMKKDVTSVKRLKSRPEDVDSALFDSSRWRSAKESSSFFSPSSLGGF